MFESPNYILTCTKCNEELLQYKDEVASLFGTFIPKCPKCGDEMEEKPIVHRGNFPKNPWKHN